MSATFIFLITASLYSSSAELITDSMSRLQKYDLKIVPPANIQATKNVRSLSHCAAICNRNKQSCLSIQYQAEASLCRLVSVRLNDEEVLEEPGSSGWKYYERNMECFDWHIFNGHAYQLDITTRNFTSAQKFCASLLPTSHVIEIESNAENNWIVELATRYCNVKSEIWINLYDSFNTQPYTWLESGQSAVYTNWAPDSPSDFEEKCATFSTSAGGTWNDVVCELLAPVVCERDL